MEALANLAQASINDRDTLASMQSTIASLTAQLKIKKHSSKLLNATNAQRKPQRRPHPTQRHLRPHEFEALTAEDTVGPMDTT